MFRYSGSARSINDLLGDALVVFGNIVSGIEGLTIDSNKELGNDRDKFTGFVGVVNEVGIGGVPGASATNNSSTESFTICSTA